MGFRVDYTLISNVASQSIPTSIATICRLLHGVCVSQNDCLQGYDMNKRVAVRSLQGHRVSDGVQTGSAWRTFNKFESSQAEGVGL